MAIGEAVYNNEKRYISKPHILHNWININKFTPINKIDKENLRTKLGFSKSDFILIMVGGCSKVKNHQRVFQLIAELPPQYAHVKCLHIGTGDHEEIEKEYCQANNISNRVHFLGTSRDVHQYMQIADLHVLPSLYEGVGNVYLEASACKLLSLVNNGPGLCEVVDFGRAGIIANAQTDEFVKVLTDIVDNPAKFAHITDAAYELIQKRHRLDTNAKELISLYEIT